MYTCSMYVVYIIIYTYIYMCVCAANSIVSYNFVQSPIASAKPRNGHCSKHLGTDIPGVYAMKGRADPARNQHGQWQPWSLGSALFFEKKQVGPAMLSDLSAAFHICPTPK